MTTAGPNYAGTVATFNFGGGVDNWANPTNAQGAADSAFATVVDSASQPYQLWATNFGFSIPAGAIISSIQYEVNVKCLSGTSTRFQLQDTLTNGAAWSGSTITTTAQWLSGVISSSLPTVSQVNGSDWGAFFSNFFGSDTNTFSVDAFRITITYSLSSGPGLDDSADCAALIELF